MPLRTMAIPTEHQSKVTGTPWAGVYGTHMHSARHFGRHWHDVFGLGVVERGAQRSASGRGKVDAFVGELITSNPGEVHDGQPLGGSSRRWRMVYLEPSVLFAMAAPADAVQGIELEIVRPVIRDPQLRHALLCLFAHLDDWNGARGANADTALACEEALVRTCGLLLDRHGSTAQPPEVSVEIRRVRDRLADDPLQPPTLTQMATMVGLSKFQLLRRFQKVYGLTPYAWLLHQRAELARRQIRAGASLADAAAASGFADQSHMTRIFARQFGFTPGALRQATSSDT